jgi:hypothetical protein
MTNKPLPASPSDTLAAVVALAPSARLRPASRAVILDLAEDGLSADFMADCAAEGNPVDSLAAHLADLVERVDLRLRWNEDRTASERAPDCEALRALSAAAAALRTA